MKTVSIALLSLLLVAFSCTDHVIPDTLLIIKTLPFELTDSGTVFKIQVDDQGKKSIKEYGIVYTAYSRGVGNHILDPTIDNNRISFNSALTLGVNNFSYTKDFINGRTFFYYRAYAIFEDGEVVYANRISFTI